MAVNVQDAINAVESHASSAQTAANNANAALADIAADGKLTPVEKQSARLQWDTILGERAGIQSRADAVSVSRAAYDSAFQTLATYLNAGTEWSSGTPSWLADANLSTTTPIDGPTFRANWKSLFDARQALLNAITAAAQTAANTAQTAANNAASAATYADRLARSGYNLVKNANSEDPNPTGYEAAGVVAYGQRTGTKCRTLVATGGYDALDITPLIQCSGGEQFRLEAYGWRVYLGAGNARVYLVFYRADRTTVAGAASIEATTTGYPLTPYAVDATAPTDASYLQVRIENDLVTAGTEVYWDDFYLSRKVSAGMLEADAVRSTTHAFIVSDTTASTSTTTGAIVATGGIATADYFTGRYRSQDGSAGLTDTKTFYAASSSGGSATVLNTVVVKNGIITSWTQA